MFNILVYTNASDSTAKLIYNRLRARNAVVMLYPFGKICTCYTAITCTNDISYIKAHAPYGAIFDRTSSDCADIHQYSSCISSDGSLSNICDYVINADRSEAAKRLYINSVYGTLGLKSAYVKYCENDVKNTMEMWTMFNSYISNGVPKIKNVIFNDPATIVFWSDGTKTVVKCQDDDWYDPEKGLAMAISKKALGNKGNYCNAIKKWLPKEEPDINWFTVGENAHALNDGLVMGIQAPTIPELAIKCSNLADKLRTKRKKSAVQKAYDLAIEIRDEAKNNNKSLNHYDIDAVIGYLGEALED